MASALAPDEAACGRYRDADSVLCLHDPVLSFSGNFYRSVPWANNSFIDWDFTTVDCLHKTFLLQLRKPYLLAFCFCPSMQH